MSFAPAVNRAGIGSLGRRGRRTFSAASAIASSVAAPGLIWPPATSSGMDIEVVARNATADNATQGNESRLTLS
jgi:hypothetical protein